MSNDKFAIRVQAVLRSCHSGVDPQVVIRGHHPVVIITPDIKDKNPDVMTVDIDSTGFETIELAAMLRALSDTMLDGVGKEVPSTTPPGQWDWDAAAESLKDVDLGENDPDGASK
jgi:hypothetical protein